MNRRAFVAGLVTVLAAPLRSHAQTATKQPRIGMLGSTPVAPTLYDMFKQGLSELGYVDKQNIVIVDSDAGDVPTRLRGLAAELVRTKVDAIFVRGPVALAAASKATKTIPIVAVDLESDPVALGYARTLAEPGGNVTGVFLDLPEVAAKHLQLFRDIVPGMRRVALIGDSIGNAAQLQATERAAAMFGIRVQSFEARTLRSSILRWRARGAVAPRPLLSLGLRRFSHIEHASRPSVGTCG